MRQGGPCVPHRRRPCLGSEATHRHRGGRRRRPTRAARDRADRRGDPAGTDAVRRRRLPGRDRRSPDRHQPDRQPSRRGGPEPRLREVRRRRAPLEHRQAGVPRHPPWGDPVPGTRPGHEPPLRPSPQGDRGLPAPGHRRRVPPRQDAEVQEQAGPRPGQPARRAAHPDGPARRALDRGAGAARRLRPGVVGAEGAGRVRDPQEPAPGGGGPGRRRRVRLRRAVRRAETRRHHDVRRLRDRLHRHPDPAGRPRTQSATAPAGGAGDRPGAGVHREPPRSDRGRRAVPRAGHLDPRRRRASTTSASPGGPRPSPRSPRRPGAPATASCSTPTRSATSRTRSASG